MPPWRFFLLVFSCHNFFFSLVHLLEFAPTKFKLSWDFQQKMVKNLPLLANIGVHLTNKTVTVENRLQINSVAHIQQPSKGFFRSLFLNLRLFN